MASKGQPKFHFDVDKYVNMKSWNRIYNRDRSHSIETAQTFQQNFFKPKQEFRRFSGGSKSFLTRMEIIEEISKARARIISPFC